jgi:glycosyltransferase involved in cell wall biosynthesis
MRIAQIAPLYEAVPPPQYGGTERIVAQLTNELVRRGHDVTLFASGDSNTTARLIPCVTESLRRSTTAIDRLAPHIAMLAKVAQMADQFDIIHNHADYLAFPFAQHWETPTVTTLHGRLDIPELPPIYQHYPKMKLISISNNQRAPLDSFGVHWVATVPNGVNLSTLRFDPRGGDYLVFLGRICEEKRPDLAVELARKTGIPLKIAAKVDPADRDWHREHMEPLLADPLVEFLGEVDDQRKTDLLCGAKALVFPSCWPEPFGIVMVEAMACGTPVIALRYGSVPEVIADGETGFICDTVDEMAAAVNRLDEIDRSTCRAWVQEHFSAEVMTDGYEYAYSRVRPHNIREFRPATRLRRSPFPTHRSPRLSG